MTILLAVLPTLAVRGSLEVVGGAWLTAALATSLLGYALVGLLASASGRPRLFQGRHRRRAA